VTTDMGDCEIPSASCADVTPQLWEGCGICRQLQEDEFRSLAQLQAALVHESSVYEALAAEGGLCNHHMWYFSRLATDALITRLVSVIVGTALDRIGSTGAAGMESSPWWRRPGADCRICRFLHDRETSYVHAFVEQACADVGAARAASPCLPHLMRTSTLCPQSDLRAYWCNLRRIVDQFNREALGGRPRVRARTAVTLSHGRRGMPAYPATDSGPVR
jgi:hypothetical protein